MAIFERQRILIWGKTRPELSRTYHETVCTGGLLAETRRLIRLYPIPLRYLEDDTVISKYRWVEADIVKSARDSRPESYKIRLDNIHAGEVIPTKNGDWGRRAEWVMNSENVYRSVEALQAAQSKDGTSLGLVRPVACLGVDAEPFPEQEKADFWRRYEAIHLQPELPFEQTTERHTKPLPPPDYRFRIHFRCDDPACSKPHAFTVFDWEVDALYFGCKRRGDSPEVARDKVIAKLRDEVCSDAKDTHFFLGNINSHRHIFTIVGLWYPKKSMNLQRGLFA